MTPKEKAMQLVDQYMDLSDEQEYNTPRYMTKEMAIQCALRTLDEIINELDHTHFADDDYCEWIINYWNEVKKEIEKI